MAAVVLHYPLILLLSYKKVLSRGFFLFDGGANPPFHSLVHRVEPILNYYRQKLREVDPHIHRRNIYISPSIKLKMDPIITAAEEALWAEVQQWKEFRADRREVLTVPKEGETYEGDISMSFNSMSFN